MDRISGPHSLSTMTTLETTSFPSCEVVPFPAAFLAIISHSRFVSSLSSHCLANSLANDGSTGVVLFGGGGHGFVVVDPQVVKEKRHLKYSP